MLAEEVDHRTGCNGCNDSRVTEDVCVLVTNATAGNEEEEGGGGVGMAETDGRGAACTETPSLWGEEDDTQGE